jgi:hypothetical protein
MVEQKTFEIRLPPWFRGLMLGVRTLAGGRASRTFNIPI